MMSMCTCCVGGGQRFLPSRNNHSEKSYSTSGGSRDPSGVLRCNVGKKQDGKRGREARVVNRDSKHGVCGVHRTRGAGGESEGPAGLWARSAEAVGAPNQDVCARVRWFGRGLRRRTSSVDYRWSGEDNGGIRSGSGCPRRGVAGCGFGITLLGDGVWLID